MQTELNTTTKGDSHSEIFRLGKRPELDGIRGLAVLAVISWHIGIPYMSAGNIGVDVFFVLSGFLITTLLWSEWLKTGDISFKKFYARRALRLLPALFAVLGLYALYVTFFNDPMTAWVSFKYITATLFYVANWAQIIDGLHHSVLGHTWSLSVEEQFYIIFPIMLLLCLRLHIKPRLLFGIVLFGIVCVFLDRFWLWQGSESIDRVGMGLDTRADALLAGCAVSAAFLGGLIPKKRSMIWLFRILSLLSMAVLSYLITQGVGNEVYYKYGGASIAAVAVGFVVFEMMGNDPMKSTRTFLRFPPLAWTGRVSYGLYLWHIPVFFVLGKPTNWSGIEVQAARFLLVYAVAALSFYLLERPFLQLKDRFTVTRDSSLADDITCTSQDQVLVPAQ